MLSFFRRMGADAVSAEDLFQETFVRIWRHRKKYRVSDPFVPWFFRIARNVLHTFASKHRPSGGRDAASVPAPDGGTPLESAERVLIVREVVDRLPAPQREALVWRFTHGLSYEEIAQVMVAPVGSVGYWIHEGLAEVGRHLKKEMVR